MVYSMECFPFHHTDMRGAAGKGGAGGESVETSSMTLSRTVSEGTVSPVLSSNVWNTHYVVVWFSSCLRQEGE